ncbi:Protein THYLAKOID ASSEMBLY 8, chloroplastic [Linum perenne]
MERIAAPDTDPGQATDLNLAWNVGTLQRLPPSAIKPQKPAATITPVRAQAAGPPNLSHLLKPDLISVLHELLRRDLCHNALSIFSVLRSEFQDQKADLNLYADPIFALLKNRMIDEIDNLLRELDAAAKEGKSENDDHRDLKEIKWEKRRTHVPRACQHPRTQCKMISSCPLEAVQVEDGAQWRLSKFEDPEAGRESR